MHQENAPKKKAGTCVPALPVRSPQESAHRISPYTALAAVPNTITGPATVNIFTAVPVMMPSARKSMAGETTELAKPVMGTSVPAPAWRASLW